MKVLMVTTESDCEGAEIGMGRFRCTIRGSDGKYVSGAGFDLVCSEGRVTRSFGEDVTIWGGQASITPVGTGGQYLPAGLAGGTYLMYTAEEGSPPIAADDAHKTRIRHLIVENRQEAVPWRLRTDKRTLDAAGRVHLTLMMEPIV